MRHEHLFWVVSEPSGFYYCAPISYGFGIDYLLGKDKLHATIIDNVENRGKIGRKDQLDAYDGCARLRPVWDEISSKYDAVITPSVPDEAPIGLEFTGEAVSVHELR